MRFTTVLCALAVACGTTSAPETTPTGPPSVSPSPEGTSQTAAQRQFTELAPFVKMAPSTGNRDRGSHGTFGIMGGGQGSPPHTHSGSYHGVVIRGELENPFGTEESPPRLGPGSYWHVPAGAEHITRCVSTEPCEFYFHADAKFDFAPLETMTQTRGDGAVTRASGRLSWTDVAPFVKMAGAYGNRATGAHGSFGRFPGGASSPVHTHSGAYRAIVIEGTMSNPFNGDESPPMLGPGSSWSVPAGSIHKTQCVSPEPCLFYFHAEEGFDFSPAEAPRQ